ncbi:hypothetical protein [Yoonia sp.]|uniref:hypothetical protein n=1 Tax=Yoonia sp. TaxID=2212373 RepID=UPI0025ED871D|nr:hypothetical protein [Yoonia sp.]
MIRGLSIIMMLSANPTQAADYYFCWTGSNNYTMTGQMTVPDAALSKPIVTADDVTRFKIAGYRDGKLLGKWDMAARGPDDTWVLNFDPATNSFLPGDTPLLGYSQGWNANGDTDNCGPGGFGFNSGGYAQDFCVNNVWIEESGIDPPTPFLVSPTPVDPFCRIIAPLS